MTVCGLERYRTNTSLNSFAHIFASCRSADHYTAFLTFPEALPTSHLMRATSGLLVHVSTQQPTYGSSRWMPAHHFTAFLTFPNRMFRHRDFTPSFSDDESVRFQFMPEHELWDLSAYLARLVQAPAIFARTAQLLHGFDRDGLSLLFFFFFFFFCWCIYLIFALRRVYERREILNHSDNNDSLCTIVKISGINVALPRACPSVQQRKASEFARRGAWGRPLHVSCTCTESFAPQQWLPFSCEFCLSLPRSPINTASGSFSTYGAHQLRKVLACLLI